ncbi:lactoylglutathione lyase [Fructobacillus sp. M2-14]|uniref:Lactoylglutathione lyase n=1 Tax=Fructobacillus broussonetiae TaxID=2713173 RepID=A0ABS5R194_9LACO|nr:lactoylglutathione lyase [Fructobacillus broussonetiae]MBS9339131.1 lactoylglutathione lyase [Fructobacillus broussonetiae]
MKVRKLNHKTIPAQDQNRAYRFWRDVFDLPQGGSQQDRILLVDHEELHFVLADSLPAAPEDDFELLVRDHVAELKKHFKNNFVPILNEEARYGNKVALTVKDSEGNTVVVEGNED